MGSALILVTIFKVVSRFFPSSLRFCLALPRNNDVDVVNSGPFGVFISVSPLASHVSGFLISMSPLASHVSGFLISVSPLASHVSGCLISVSPLASYASVKMFEPKTLSFLTKSYAIVKMSYSITYHLPVNQSSLLQNPILQFF